MGWARTALPGLDPGTLSRLDALPPMHLPKGQILFNPGEAARGFAIVLNGRVEVFLTGPTGRDILLYAVEPGQSCVQSTLGLLGGEDYTGEAITATECDLVLVPKDTFLALMDGSAPFRHFVFGAFAGRMQGMMALLERVAFQKVESRLARALLDRAIGDRVEATHQELATIIGSAREVISRRLEALSKRGLVRLDRGVVTLTDRPGLARLAEIDAPSVT
ncbi:Crp/Fnr family transcriptional regulator [Actibacterium ureilyticum]|uniref:Crp/Fnr family transcriptional regulator n=1 Tax=Actibacterium ureilyticum TaxID=1590614 RepID=UPI000BAADD2B|nr:Crp/Fnr family transcriptional regulator [Actibacterium ureilyticum]